MERVENEKPQTVNPTTSGSCTGGIIGFITRGGGLVQDPTPGAAHPN